MKKKNAKQITIHTSPIQRKNTKRYNRKLLFQKKETPTLTEIDSYLTTIETPAGDTHEQPIQQNKERILAEIESFINHREHPERYNRKLIFHKSRGTLQAKQLSLKRKVTLILTGNIIELILLIIGLFYLTQPTIANIKISITLILIATFLLFLLTDQPKTIVDAHTTSTTKPPLVENILRTDTPTQKIRSTPPSNKICLILILWTLLLYIFVSDLEIYFILLFIGLLITREITDQHISNTYKMKLNIYIIIFLATYIILISQKIIDILNI